ncbi:MAG: hypothetical protein KF718_02785 [Polyangiaceae bacterium]|nr:hypothetical protein [Polyangiaceae bacterium]
MRLRSILASVVISSAVVGCAQPAEEAPEPIAPALLGQILDDVPSDVPNKTFIDFDGKVVLVGYELEPSGTVRPGERFKLKLYWRSMAPLGKDWSLFTHLLTLGGQRVAGDFDNVGPLRDRASGEQALPPSRWQPGRVYVDEQELMMPQGVQSPVVTVVVGIWKPGYRLNILSGPADGERRAIIAHIPTGVEPVRPPVNPSGPSQPAAPAHP